MLPIISVGGEVLIEASIEEVPEVETYYGLDLTPRPFEEYKDFIIAESYDYVPREFTVHTCGPIDPSTITLGLEFEFNFANRSRVIIAKATCDLNKHSLLIYAKSDGSVRNGKELVTMPMTLEYIMAHEELFKGIIENKDLLISDDCGNHIHMANKLLTHNRRNFSNALLSNTAILSEFIRFNANRVCYNQVRRYASVDNLLSNALDKQVHNQFINTAKGGKERVKVAPLKDESRQLQQVYERGRYQFVNTSNSQTLEYRMWGGTKSWEEYKFFLVTTEVIARASLSTTPTLFDGLDSYVEFVKSLIQLNDPNVKTYTEYLTNLEARIVDFYNSYNFKEHLLKRGYIQTFEDVEDIRNSYFYRVPANKAKVGDFVITKQFMYELSVLAGQGARRIGYETMCYAYKITSRPASGDVVSTISLTGNLHTRDLRLTEVFAYRPLYINPLMVKEYYSSIREFTPIKPIRPGAREVNMAKEVNIQDYTYQVAFAC